MFFYHNVLAMLNTNFHNKFYHFITLLQLWICRKTLDPRLFLKSELQNRSSLLYLKAYKTIFNKVAWIFQYFFFQEIAQTKRFENGSKLQKK